MVPDLITVAKSLAGGYPLAGVVGRAEVMDALAPGGLGGTYGGNQVAPPHRAVGPPGDRDQGCFRPVPPRWARPSGRGLPRSVPASRRSGCGTSAASARCWRSSSSPISTARRRMRRWPRR
ncbi:MAG: aminotransferase class III-fold pyridoxal phosphate-dependent enzyme [Paracoccaceae bacterium]